MNDKYHSFTDLVKVGSTVDGFVPAGVGPVVEQGRAHGLGRQGGEGPDEVEPLGVGRQKAAGERVQEKSAENFLMDAAQCGACA